MVLVASFVFVPITPLCALDAAAVVRDDRAAPLVERDAGSGTPLEPTLRST
jgi:hypothetical protein